MLCRCRRFAVAMYSLRCSRRRLVVAMHVRSLPRRTRTKRRTRVICKVNAVQTVHIPPVCARVRSQVRVGGKGGTSHRPCPRAVALSVTERAPSVVERAPSLTERAPLQSASVGKLTECTVSDRPIALRHSDRALSVLRLTLRAPLVTCALHR